jgi:hypothetical protein
MKRIIHLNKEIFEEVKLGNKKFEVRLGNEKINVGDILVIKQRGEDGKETGQEIKKKVERIGRTKDLKFWPEKEKIKHGFTIIQMGKL